jgi:hypothetical protein
VVAVSGGDWSGAQSVVAVRGRDWSGAQSVVAVRGGDWSGAQSVAASGEDSGVQSAIVNSGGAQLRGVVG